MTTKLAPTLEWLARHDWQTWTDGIPPHITATGGREDATWNAATSELRALLRVARAAKRVEDGDATDFSAEIALSRALSALDRVSGRQRKGGRP